MNVNDEFDGLNMKNGRAQVHTLIFKAQITLSRVDVTSLDESQLASSLQVRVEFEHILVHVE
jgi:hypothetical protein